AHRSARPLRAGARACKVAAKLGASARSSTASRTQAASLLRYIASRLTMGTPLGSRFLGSRWVFSLVSARRTRRLDFWDGRLSDNRGGCPSLRFPANQYERKQWKENDGRDKRQRLGEDRLHVAAKSCPVEQHPVSQECQAEHEYRNLEEIESPQFRLLILPVELAREEKNTNRNQADSPNLVDS